MAVFALVGSMAVTHGIGAAPLRCSGSHLWLQVELGPELAQQYPWYLRLTMAILFLHWLEAESGPRWLCSFLGARTRIGNGGLHISGGSAGAGGDRVGAWWRLEYAVGWSWKASQSYR